ncbi:MAG: CHAT domain-containing tetratricopeptide repeat protein [Acidobacteriota bacterium]
MVAGVPAAVRAQAPPPAGCDELKHDPLPAWPDSAETSKRLTDCGYALTHDGDYARAATVFAAALDMARRRADRSAEAVALDGYGLSLGTLGQLDKAETLLKQSFTISEELADKDGMAEASSQLGHIRNVQARYDEARDYHLRSYRLWESIGSLHGMAVALNNVGAMYRAVGDNATAADYYQRSLEALQTLGDRRRSATVIDNLARNARVLGDYASGRALALQALAIREEFKDREGIGRSLTSLSENERAEGNYTAALDSLRRSLDIFTAVGNVHAIAETLNNVAVVYEAQGNYAQAASYLRRSLALNDAVVGSASLTVEIDTHLGEVLFREGQRARALQPLERGVALGDAAGLTLQAAEARVAAARVYASLGQLTRAEDALRQVLTFRQVTGDCSGRAEALIVMSDVELRRRRPAAALESAQEALGLAEAMDLVDVEWLALTAMGRADAALGRRGDARSAFDRAIAVVEDLRDQNPGGEEVRRQFFADRLAPYQEQIALTLAGPGADAAAAFDVAERSRARALLDIIRSDRVPITKAMSVEERTREVKLRTSLTSANSEVLLAAGAAAPDASRLAALKRKRDGRRVEYQDFQAHLYAVHPELQVNRGAVPVIRAAEAVQLLPGPAAAIVEFVTARDRTHAFVITTSGIHVVRLTPGTGEIDRQVRRFREQLARRDLRASESARLLYDLVLGPLQTLLQGKTDIIVVPDGMLWSLPFQALRSPANRYLIEDAAISYAPSVTVLREAMRRPHTRPSSPPALLAFGSALPQAAAPDGGQPAPGPRRSSDTEAEVAQLARIYGPTSRVYTGAEAREDRWKAEAPAFGVVHIASHGVLDDGSPLYSHLVLSPPQPGDKEDGLLEAWEIMAMQLKADLVVLSACETARGRVTPGEGIIGLMWAVFVAGTPATLVSQWQVESGSSARLMVGFHEEWRGGQRGVSRARALQLAALRLLKTRDYAHPFYWAGFILAGDGR